MKQRPHAEIIKLWADGHQIQYRQDAGMMWTDVDDPAFVADYEYRVKPAEPERVHPMLDLAEVDRLAEHFGLQPGTVDLVSRRAVRYMLDHGQVVTREEFDRAVGDRAERDWRIADKVAAEMATLLHPSVALRFYNLDLKAIIAKVKA